MLLASARDGHYFFKRKVAMTVLERTRLSIPRTSRTSKKTKTDLDLSFSIKRSIACRYISTGALTTPPGET